LTIQNEFFWTAGSDGVLRIQECRNCDALIHPPQPVCRYCRSRDMGVRDVSGKATISAFTVNHRFGFPDLPPPYVVAQVAIVEDPRVRLTTNIVECEPDELKLGQAVEVVFEKIEDVWLPMFRPAVGTAAGPRAADEIAPQDFAKHVSPMLTKQKFEDAAAITGIGMSKLGRRQMVPPLSLTIDACEQAVAEAGLTFDDIDGLSTYPGLDIAGMGEGGVTALEGALGLRPTWINGGMDTFGPGGSVIAAMMAVATGLARHVLCFRTLWEATFQQLMKDGRMSPPGGPRTSSWQLPFGATSAAHVLALNAQRHFDRYGTTRETLGWIAMNQRANAALNPTAIYRDPMSMDDYLSARMITTPFEAVGTQIVERTDWDQTTMTHEPQVLGQAAHLWTRTSLRPKDIDVAELYDGFTFNCLSWLEALGFCGIGEAKDFLDGGKAIARDGVIPLNTHGGQLSHGRTHGMGLIHEAVTQLRGEAGERQVNDARVAVVSSGGLTPSGAILLRADA
jgi:acetyl-CoA acetyltransferase/uncharacterized OB-fold protein